MRFRSLLRAAAVALTALFGAGLTAAHADSGTISIRIFKAGFVIGGSAGSAVLHFHGHSYPLSIGGLSYGFTFGASENQRGAVLTLTGAQAGVIVSLDLSGLALTLK